MIILIMNSETNPYIHKEQTTLLINSETNYEINS